MKKTILLSLLFVFSCQFMSHAQWLEKKEDGYFKLGTWSLKPINIIQILERLIPTPLVVLLI